MTSGLKSLLKHTVELQSVLLMKQMEAGDKTALKESQTGKKGSKMGKKRLSLKSRRRVKQS